MFFRPIFAFLFIEFGTRKVMLAATTRFPSPAWVTQQLRNATPSGVAPRFLIRDRDDKFGPAFDALARATGIRLIRTAVRANMNAVCECAIMPLGDSVTFGTTYAGSYRVQLFHLALADAKLITFVGSMANGPTMVDGTNFPRNNEGHSGYIISLQTGWSGLNPKVTDIILMIGTNDMTSST